MPEVPEALPGALMPTYEFVCCNCWDQFEAMRPVAERDAASCPKCGTAAVREFTPCAIRMPCPEWGELTRHDLLPEKSGRVFVTPGVRKGG